MPHNAPLPLEGLFVLDFSQFLAGPYAALRLADMGARVVKIERADGRDASRALRLANLAVDGESVLFHTINRNKESLAVDLKNLDDLERVKGLITHADVLVQSFRPSVMERLGLDYERVHAINPRIVYGSISGYGTEGPWRDKPGQDLLVQAVTGLPWLNGNRDQDPLAMGLSVVDTLAGCHLAEGLLACLVRRGMTGEGGLVEVNLMEAAIDFQFEVLTTYLNNGGQLPERSAFGNAHPYLGAPYGIYPTKDGYLALAMNPLMAIADVLDIPQLGAYSEPESWFHDRDDIKRILAPYLAGETTEHWLSILEPAGIWCAEVYTWPRLLETEAFTTLDMLQDVNRAEDFSLRTTRCPIRIDGAVLKSPAAAPRLGEHHPLPGESA